MKINIKQKELIKIYTFLFALLFIISGWENVSWAFNYKEVSGLIHIFFNPYPERNILVSAGGGGANIVSAEEYESSVRSNTLEIEKIGVDVPIVIGKSSDLAVLEDDLNKGVVYYPGSVLPGQNGQIIILGHSAPPNWPHVKYDWVFSEINNLNTGDKIIFYFNGKKYVYGVKGKEIIQKGGDITLREEDKGKNILTLVSCWPPGKNYKRIALSAVLEK